MTEKEKQQVVNAAVDINQETPKDYKCQICLMTLFEPKECVSCEVATFCTPCIDLVLKTTSDAKCPLCRKNDGFRNLHRKLMSYLNEC